MIITIDGAAGTGKSSLGQWLATQLNYHYLDTGWLYRAFCYFCLAKNITFDNQTAINQILQELHIDINQEQSSIRFNHQLIPFSELYSAVITKNTVLFARNKTVRAGLNQFFRSLVLQKNFVAVGRDLGSAVFPQANLKLFLICSLKIRAKRRARQQRLIDVPKNVDLVHKNITERDQIDRNRKIAPLKKPAGCLVFDNSFDSLAVARKKLLQLVQEALI